MLLSPRVQVLSLTHHTHALVGDLVLPAGGGPYPLVVTVFGSGPGGRHAGDWPQRVSRSTPTIGPAAGSPLATGAAWT